MPICLVCPSTLVLFTLSVSHELPFPCGKACLWPHAFRTRYTCIFVCTSTLVCFMSFMFSVSHELTFP